MLNSPMNDDCPRFTAGGQFNRTLPAGPPITFAVCSNNPARIRTYTPHNLPRIAGEDRMLVVFDADEEPSLSALAEELRSAGVSVIFAGRLGGLAHARNAAIRNAGTRYLVFIDDDVTFSERAVEEIGKAFESGSHVVGARLEPGPGVDLSKWYISQSQLHYVGLHREGGGSKTWGACMGFDLEFVRRYRLEFRPELGRKGRSLISGEDTTFIGECLKLRARETFLRQTCVYHHVAPDRLRLTRMLSRALWQGRSEVRRSNIRRGVLKEWRRNIFGWCRTPIKTLGLAVLYQAMVLLGVVIESFSPRATRGTDSSAGRIPELPSPESRRSVAAGTRENLPG